MITFSAKVKSAIRLEGERAYPDECCGVLLGRFGEDENCGEAMEIFPVSNGREAEEQYHRFVIQPDDFMKVEMEARGRGLDVLGFYHSHPDHPALPSDYDREHALPFYFYVILTVEKGQARTLTGWKLAADRARFIQKPLNEGGDML
ncbi:MAG: M67 family metallopeptidase [Synergistaceae bacterium]|jgi:proteasome lid subunit RPN8/RPN11|nr:M67 family metallopeptidase [Synergistaceae bacterium]